jgi:hypothetical protein
MSRSSALPWLLALALVLAAARVLMPAESLPAAAVVEPVSRAAAVDPENRAAVAEPVSRAAPLEPRAVTNDQPPAATEVEPGPRFDARLGQALFGAAARPGPAKAPAPAVSVPAPPPPPLIAAPERPAFTVIGVFQPRGEATSLWINQGGQLTLARLGDVVDAHWRIEAIERNRVRLLHTSLATPAELPLPAELAR